MSLALLYDELHSHFGHNNHTCKVQYTFHFLTRSLTHSLNTCFRMKYRDQQTFHAYCRKMFCSKCYSCRMQVGTELDKVSLTVCCHYVFCTGNTLLNHSCQKTHSLP